MGSTGNDQPQVQVLTRDAGRALDALVAEKVMGEPVTWLPTALSHRDPHQSGEVFGAKGWHRVPSYSTDIADAWLVVEKMRERGFVISATPNQQSWCATFGADSVWGETAPLAICRAALAAVEAV